MLHGQPHLHRRNFLINRDIDYWTHEPGNNVYSRYCCSTGYHFFHFRTFIHTKKQWQSKPISVDQVVTTFQFFPEILSDRLHWYFPISFKKLRIIAFASKGGKKKAWFGLGRYELDQHPLKVYGLLSMA